MKLGRALLGLAGILLLGGAAFFIFAREPAIAPMAPAGPSFDPALIAKGAQLAKLGNCSDCHTRPDGAPYAGGYPLKTPLGTIFATNITPDRETGIGAWPEAAFVRAMREGVRRDGEHLYPAFPYDHFTKISSEDLRALYAFLMTRTPVRAETPPNPLPFPLSVRALIAGWKLLYFEPGPFGPDPAISPELNRGAYLVEALAHCGACHTPRNALGAERRDRYLGGGEAEGWHAPALNAASPAPVPWTKEQLFTYLRRGFEPSHGVAAGPMQPVANNLASVPEEDVRAIAAYIGAIIRPAGAERPQEGGRPVAEAPAGSTSRGLGEQAPELAAGATIYAGACAACHEPTGQRFSAHGIPLARSKLITMPDPRNLAHVILNGIEPPLASPAATMPGFANAMTDEQVAALMAYLRSTFSSRPPWTRIEEQVREVRASRNAS